MSPDAFDGRAIAPRVALAVLAGVLGTALVAGGLWMAFGPGRDSRAGSGFEPSLPALPSQPSTPAPGSDPATNAPGADSGAVAVVTSTPAGKRAAVVAFRLGASIYVAAEDGGGAVAITRSAEEEPYALSPDGRTLAVVQGGMLQLVDVRTRALVSAGTADAGMRPEWSSDSTRVVFRRTAKNSGDGFDIWSVSRSGTDAKRLVPGKGAAWSPAGNVLVTMTDSAPDPGAGGGAVSVSVDGGDFKTFAVRTTLVTAVGTDGKRVYVGTTEGGSTSRLLSFALDGTGEREIAKAVPGERIAFWSKIVPAPGDGPIALQANGDDGYARSFLIASAGGTFTELSRLRDARIHAWSASGEQLFLIEGNAFQGQQTSLVCVGRDGSGRRDIVTGAR